jgi:hypothetical protein
MATAMPVWASAQDSLPKRKPGLWDLSMTLPGMGNATTKSKQCIDEKTDAQAQRRAIEQEPGSRCEQSNVKRSANSYEVDYTCQGASGKTEGRVKFAGDFSSRYTMENRMHFDPPRRGMSEATMTMQAQWAGACPAGMKPGEVRVTGMPLDIGTGAGGARPQMSPEQMKKMQEMMEQLKQQRPPK